MHRIFRVKAYEAEHGPHFNEEHARKAVSKMENEDGTRGPHWSVEETTALASQYGINLGSRFNRYDWFVALNMVYSDYYKVIISMTNSNSTKHFVELAKAWINDKDIDEGKMWYYYIYVMCDKIRQAEMECYEEEVEKRDKYEDDDDDEFERIDLFRRGGRRGGMMRGGRRVYSTSRARDYDDDYEHMAITSGNATLASELANCCCTTQRSIDAVNNNITKMGYENQLSVCNQTNNLVNTMNSNTLALRDSGTANTQSIIAKLDAMQNQALLDKIDSLRERNSTLLTQLSQEHQTATFGNMISSATAPIVTKLNSLQSDVDGIKCKLPNTVSVPYPQLSCYNPEIFRAAAMGAYAGDAAFNGVGYNNGCGCGC